LINLKTLRLEKNDNVLTVWLNREDKANAINLEMLKELITLADWLREQSEIKFVVFTNGGKTFSAGFDLNQFSEFMEKDQKSPQHSRLVQISGQEMMRKIENIEQVTISAIRGSAYGGGVCLIMATDFRLMTDNSVLNLPETNVGIFLGWGGTSRLVNAVGAVKAKEMIMMCEDVTAEECHKLGLINKVVSSENIDCEVKQIIEKIHSKGQLSIRLAKKTVNSSIAHNVGDILVSEPELFERVTISNETQQLINSFKQNS